jgi:hypothetical protein
MNDSTKLFAAALSVCAATASAQVAAVRVAAPSVGAAPAAMSAALSAASAVAAPALAVSPLSAPSLPAFSAPAAAPRAVPAAAPALAPAAALPAAQASLNAGAARLGEAAKPAAAPDAPRALSAALFDGSALRAAADGPSFPIDLSFPEPSAHAAAAQAAAGPDAHLIAASAHLQNRSETWVYTFLSPKSKETIKIAVDFRGRATELSRTPSRGIAHAAPLDMGRVITLAAAYAVARRGSFYPETVSLERDPSGRAQYRFEGLGDQQVIVDAENGDMISGVR